MIQKNTGDISLVTGDKSIVDTRPSGWEADKAAAAEAKAKQIDEQKTAPVGSPAGIDSITPVPSSAAPMPQLGAESTQAPDESKTPTFALPAEPSKPAEGSAPEAITTEGALGSSPTDIEEEPQTAPAADQPTKKPGFFGKLFG